MLILEGYNFFLVASYGLLYHVASVDTILIKVTMTKTQMLHIPCHFSVISSHLIHWGHSVLSVALFLKFFLHLASRTSHLLGFPLTSQAAPFYLLGRQLLIFLTLNLRTSQISGLRYLFYQNSPIADFSEFHGSKFNFYANNS